MVLFPPTLLASSGVEAPKLRQCVGMIVGVYGVAYAAAALDPLRRWPVVMAGLLGKVLGPIGFVGAAVRGVFPIPFGPTIVLTDLMGWVPFSLILPNAYKTRPTRKGATA